MKVDSLSFKILNTNKVLEFCGGSNFNFKGYVKLLNAASPEDLKDKMSTPGASFGLVNDFGLYRKDLCFINLLIHAYKFYNDLSYKRDKKSHPKNKYFTTKDSSKIFREKQSLNNLNTLIKIQKILIKKIHQSDFLSLGGEECYCQFLDKNCLLGLLKTNGCIMSHTGNKYIYNSDGELRGLVSEECFLQVKKYIINFQPIGFRSGWILSEDFNEIIKEEFKDKIKYL